ncbi:MAG: ABC transporter ATP-binding protein [Bacillales bacterium]|nr:ABC transporter ATP-binding protein [Bacillales bacterium]
MDSLIKLDNVNKSFFSSLGETKVLKNISFDVNNEEIVCILGPSGCGKSTILNILSSLEDITKGEIKINCKLGYMFQKDNLLSWKNVKDNILFGLKITKKNTLDNQRYALSLANKYGLNDFLNYYPKSLSGGMKQRVSLIRTLSLKPDLLLLDEPFSALDAQTRLSLQDDIYTIIKEEKKSVLMITHDIYESISISDRIIVLSNRPSQIKKEIRLPFKNIKPNQRRKMEEFHQFYKEIFDLLANE